MMRAVALVILLPLVLGGCATTYSNGVRAYDRGDTMGAYQYFLACAQRGESGCMNNIGVLYANGKIADSQSRTKAIYWYSLAARYGNRSAQMNLSNMGQPVPPADLAPRPMSDAEFDAYGKIGEGLGDAIRNRR